MTRVRAPRQVEWSALHHHCFFFGDLNYRVQMPGPDPGAKPAACVNAIVAAADANRLHRRGADDPVPFGAPRGVQIGQS